MYRKKKTLPLPQHSGLYPLPGHVKRIEIDTTDDLTVHGIKGDKIPERMLAGLGWELTVPYNVISNIAESSKHVGATRYQKQHRNHVGRLWEGSRIVFERLVDA